MLLEILFFICLSSGYISSRSLTLRDRSQGGMYYSDSKIFTILMFVNMVSTFTIVVWGFIYIKWYIVVGSFIFNIFFSSNYFIGNKLPLNEKNDGVLMTITILLNAGLWAIKII